MRTLLTLASSWGVMLALFFALGDRISDGLAAWLWEWDRSAAYGAQVWWPSYTSLTWWPFRITSFVVTYSGFALSGWLVARMNRPYAAPMLLVHAASVVMGLILSAVIIEVLTHRNGFVPTPHGLYYFLQVALPFQWRSGLLLAPLVIVSSGLLGSGRFSIRANTTVSGPFS